MEKKSIEISIVVASEIEKKSLTRDSVFFLLTNVLIHVENMEPKKVKVLWQMKKKKFK